MKKIIILALSILLLTPMAWAGGSYALNHGFNAKHTPLLSAPAKVKAGQPFVVEIHVGEKQHPSLVDHHVEWLQLYAGEMLLAHVQLTPTMTLPNLSLTVMLEESADLKVVEAPNHSAGWVSKTVHVEVVK
ncbi:MAG: desulfoferrodoxin family protein [Mariprofundales bacterium]